MMTKSIYDVLNTVDLYIRITESIYSKNNPFWDEIVDVQKRVISVLSDKDLNAIILKEIVDSSDEVYLNMHSVVLNKKQRLLEFINLHTIKIDEDIFLGVFERKESILNSEYRTQLKKTTAIRQEYESYDKAFQSATYSMSENEHRLLGAKKAQEQKILKPNFILQTNILDELYSRNRKFIHENIRYIKSYHIDLLAYLDDLISVCFIRKVKSNVNNAPDDLILNGSILPNSNVFHNIYAVLADDVFEQIERNSFVNIFQGHHSKTKLKIRKGNVQNVYFILYNLSEYLVKDNSKNWLEHVIYHIEWTEEWSLENILVKIRKKRKGASEEIKEKLAQLIYIDPKEFK